MLTRKGANKLVKENIKHFKERNNMTTAKHTPNQYPPRPWAIEQLESGHAIVDSNGVFILEGSDRNIKEHIVKCVNSHEKLIEALKRAIDCEKRNGILSIPCIEEMKEALKESE